MTSDTRSPLLHGSSSPDPEVAVDVHDDSHDVDEHVHYSQRAPWLRAFVLGATDGLVSVAALMVGVGGGTQELQTMRLSGLAATVGGALSMAVGEYISVAAQKDTEERDIEQEKQMQAAGPAQRQHELEELAQIYEDRGLSKELAMTVAQELTAKDVIRAHARDELGIDLDELANPLQAGLVSCFAFSMGAAMPLLAGSFINDYHTRLISILAVTSLGLALFGLISSILGGVKYFIGMFRVVFGGWVAMGATFGVGRLFGVDAA